MITLKRPSPLPWKNCPRFKAAIDPVTLKLPRKSRIFIFGAVFLFVLFFSSSAQVFSRELPAIQKHIQNGGYALAKNGKVLYASELKTPFIPASTIKLVTSLAALNVLGPDFRFHTKLFLDREQNLIIQGFGDPFLVSEKVTRITKRIAGLGISNINNIILDDHAFALDSPTEGSMGSKNPYDVNCSALAVNFNTLPLRTYRKAKIQSPETQTPYISLMGRIGRNAASGYHRVNVDAYPPQGKLSNSLRYCGELFKALLENQGINVSGTIKHGKRTEDSQLLLDFTASETVEKLIESCLLSSNNFMANQLYLTLGVKRFGYPATWQKSRLVMADFIANDLQLGPEQITMIEGSGLSTKNRLTVEALLLVLERFRSYASLIPIKYGTRMKSGTLNKSGVFCYAGYIPNGKDSSTFVILLNQKRNRRDQILKILSKQ
jgi:serine-type D-Ala-D-Ala carboxypeptidase/endopeptidase (penicillin-binding protein 4)